MPFEIVFAESVLGQMQALTARDRAIVLEAIERQLTFEPLTETRNRKPRRSNPIAPWELRVGTLRVFYQVTVPETAESTGEVSESATPTAPEPRIVQILAIGHKHGNVLRIAGRDIPT